MDYLILIIYILYCSLLSAVQYAVEHTSVFTC